MSAYRVPAYVEPAAAIVAPAPPRGLVRSNGTACHCRPPGALWCWWFTVRVGDHWICKHGGAWLRKERSIYVEWWPTKPPESVDP